MKIYIKYPAYRFMMLAAKYADNMEIAGLLYGKKNVVEEADLFEEQDLTYSSVDVSPKAFAEHLAKLPEKKIGRIIGIWHSHGSMSAFLSAIDDSTAEAWLQVKPWMIMITVNREGKIYAAVYVEVFGETVKVPCETELWLGEDKKLRNTIDRLRAKNIKTTKYNIIIEDEGVERGERRGAEDLEWDVWARHWPYHRVLERVYGYEMDTGAMEQETGGESGEDSGNKRENKGNEWSSIY